MDWLRAGASRQEFERFVTDRSGPLLRTAYLMAGNLAEAEDLVQEALLRVARHWPRVRVMAHPAAYARQILINVALDGAANGPAARANSPRLTARVPETRLITAPA